MTSDTPKRILHALSLEKHLTPKQLCRLLFPQDKAAYKRVMYHLEKMRGEGLLKSKSYGLGVEMLWSMAKSKVIKDLGYTPPDDVHSILYEHEKFAGDIFVALALTGQLYGWESEGDQKIGFRFDRRFTLGSLPFFLEVELGNKWDQRFEKQISAYQKHWATTHEPFSLLVVVPDGEVGKCLEFLPDYHYYAAHISDLSENQLKVKIHTPNKTTTLETLLESVSETP